MWRVSEAMKRVLGDSKTLAVLQGAQANAMQSNSPMHFAALPLPGCFVMEQEEENEKEQHGLEVAWVSFGGQMSRNGDIHCVR